MGGGGRDTAGTSGTTAPPAATAVVKTEGVDLALFNQTIQMMQAFLAGRSGGAGGAPRTGGGVVQGAGGAPGNFLCNFCGDPEHFMRNCGIILQYILDRKIYRDETGKVRLPNSMFVPRGLPGEYMKDRVDSWHAQNPGQLVRVAGNERQAPPHLAANLFQIYEGVNMVETRDEGSSDEEDPSERVRVLQAELARAKKKEVRFEEVKKTGARTGAALRGPGGKPPGIPAANIPRTSEEKAKGSEGKGAGGTTGQYKYQTEIEQRYSVAEATKKLYGTKVEMTVGEVLAISAGVRKEVKGDVTTSRVATAGLVEVDDEDHWEDAKETFQVTEGGASIGHESLALRAVEPVIEGKFTCECVLDGGAQIVAMRKDIWEKTGIVLKPDEAITMETANSAQVKTVGKAQNVRFTFGSVDLYLQLQVLDDAPFEVLLGRPFFALTACETRDFPSGEQQITLTDPETGERVMVATKPRNGRRKPSAAGFQ